ncbi:uncharacterized protein LOC129602786 [Paramacrobiotus metropolitanus]|uniref:uncharacterized protein LOC129602786 n=1 Tax=Paramacrobiotus metropolitanus TaxID=2943436 RepID=UPI002445AE7A|nr:uncharacterized protein LOC129602786 [Paramacrobiotus metropolitanus]
MRHSSVFDDLNAGKGKMSFLKPGPLNFLGAVQLCCGIAVLVTEIVSLSFFGFTLTRFSALPLGILYIITGVFGMAAASSLRPTAQPSRCALVTSLALSIVSFLSAIALVIWLFVFLTTFNPADLTGTLRVLAVYIATYTANIAGPLLAFLWLMIIVSSVMMVVAGRGVSQLNQPTVVVTQIAHPGVQFVYSNSLNHPEKYPPPYLP